MKTFLTRKVRVDGGRDGQISGLDNALSLKLSKPVEMGAKSQSGTDPETLFSAGYASCFASSIEFMLMQNKQSYDDLRVTADTLLVEDEEGGFKFKLDVFVELEGLSQTAKEAVVEQAKNFCPYSKAIKATVEITYQVS